MDYKLFERFFAPQANRIKASKTKEMETVLKKSEDALNAVQNTACDKLEKAGDSLLNYGVATDVRFKKVKKTAAPEDDRAEIIRRRNERRNKTKIALYQHSMIVARNTAAYEDYDYAEGNGFSVYKARRVGKNHLEKNTVCQDYCEYAQLSEQLLVLVVADGVGSKIYSDIGSKTLTKMVIKTIQAFYDEMKKNDFSEQKFFRLLFHRNIREEIIRAFNQEIENDIRQKGESGITAKRSDYATNLAFAVVSPSLCFAAVIGDCQIMLFNDDFGVKHRLHPSKDGDQTTASIVDANCANECFVMDLYDMSDYSGILLSTDGIYDYLEPAEMFFDFCTQAKKRFLEHREPYLPFCYTSKRERMLYPELNIGMMDIGYMKKGDDNSLVAALYNRNPYSSVTKNIQEEYPVNYAIKHNAEASWFKIKKIDRKQETAVECDLICVDAKKDLKIHSSVAKKITATECEKRRTGCKAFFIYDNLSDFTPLETMFNSGMFKLRHCKGEKALAIGKILRAIHQLEQELEMQDLDFSANAKWLLQLDENYNLYYLPGAFCKKGLKSLSPATIWSYFKLYLGYFYTENNTMPITNLVTQYSSDGGKPFFEPCDVNGQTYLKNISNKLWLVNGERIESGEMVAFINGLDIEMFEEDYAPTIYHFNRLK